MDASERFSESYHIVDSVLNSPLANAVIKSINPVGIVDESPVTEGHLIASANWSLYLSLLNDNALKLHMAATAPPLHSGFPAAPAVLTISEVSPQAYTFDGTSDVQVTISVSRPYTVREFLDFLKDEGMLKYEVSYGTHAAYWLFKVVERLAFNHVVPGGSSMAISQQVDAFNKFRAADRAKRWKEMKELMPKAKDEDLPPPLFIDSGVMSNPGSFVKDQSGQDLGTNTSLLAVNE